MIIVRYNQHFWRMGSLTETFACSDIELRALKAWGSYNHGEVLGKHSDIAGTFDDTTLTVLTDDAAFIDAAIGHGLVGGCPFVDQISESVNEDRSLLSRFISAGISELECEELARVWHFVDFEDV